MGKVYFELDNSTETREPLFDFFEQLGFTIVKEPSFNEPGFYHTITYTNNDGLTFDVMWFRNLATIRIGEWGKAFIECSFNKIIGSFIPNSEHLTFDFMNDKTKKITLSVKNNKIKIR